MHQKHKPRSLLSLGKTIAACVLLAAAGQTTVAAASTSDNPYDGGWHFTLTPYIWIPGVNADFKFNIPPGANGKPNVSAGPTDILSLLQFAFMGAADVRKGKWSAFTDFAYLDLSGDKGAVKSISGPGGNVEIPLNVHTTIGLKGSLWTTGVGYSVYRGGGWATDVFLGVRHLGLDPSFDWNLSGTLSLLPAKGHFGEHQQLWDGLIGMRGRFRFPRSHWFIPYYADVGTGESNITYQLMAGAGYSCSWGDIKLVYRYMHYDPGNTKLIKTLNLYGPALGVTFRL